MGRAYDAYLKVMEKTVLQEDMGLEKLQAELNRFWDGILLELAHTADDTYARNVYRVLIQQAKTQTGSFKWLGDPEVFHNITGTADGKKKKPWLGIGAAIIMAGLTVWFALPFNGFDIVFTIVGGVALLLLLIQGVISWVARERAQNALSIHSRTEQRLSIKRIQSTLEYMVKEMDAHVESLQAAVQEIQASSASGDIALVKDLLKLPANMRSEAVTDTVNMYLVRNGIKKIEYSKENAEMFMTLPSETEMTIEPALVKDDKLLHVGVACVKVEG